MTIILGGEHGHVLAIFTHLLTVGRDITNDNKIQNVGSLRWQNYGKSKQKMGVSHRGDW